MNTPTPPSPGDLKAIEAFAALRRQVAEAGLTDAQLLCAIMHSLLHMDPRQVAQLLDSANLDRLAQVAMEVNRRPL